MTRPQTVVTTTNRYIRSLGSINPYGEVLASVARSLAHKLLQAQKDEATSSEANAAALAFRLTDTLATLEKL